MVQLVVVGGIQAGLVYPMCDVSSPMTAGETGCDTICVRVIKFKCESTYFNLSLLLVPLNTQEGR